MIPKKTNRRNEFYAVASGRIPGVYLSQILHRADAGPQVGGFSGNTYKKFQTQEEAEEFIQRYNATKGLKILQTPTRCHQHKPSESPSPGWSAAMEKACEMNPAHFSTPSTQSNPEKKAQAEATASANSSPFSANQDLTTRFSHLVLVEGVQEPLGSTPAAPSNEQPRHNPATFIAAKEHPTIPDTKRSVRQVFKHIRGLAGVEQTIGLDDATNVDQDESDDIPASALGYWFDHYLFTHGYTPKAVLSTINLYGSCKNSDGFVDELVARGMPVMEARFLRDIIRLEHAPGVEA